MKFMKRYKVGDFLLIVKDATIPECNGVIGRVVDIDHDGYFIKIINRFRFDKGNDYERYPVYNDDTIRKLSRNETILEML